MATQPEGVYFLNNLSNVVVNQPTVTVNQVTNNFHTDPHSALRYLYDASARYAGTGHPDAASTCLEGTRETALQEIDTWKQKQLAPASTSELLWLTGGAGTGKSVIAQTTCERFEADGIPVVHCFLSNSSHRTHPTYVFLTIAYQLAIKISALKSSIEAVIQADPSVVDEPIDKQLRRLVLNPIRVAGKETLLPTIFIVIDGLDECNSEQAQIQIIRLIQSTILGPPVPLRFLIASRPELWIRNTLISSSVSPITMVTLDQSKETDNDIRFFYMSEFKKIRADPEHQDAMLTTPLHWPSDYDLDILVRRASGQFVYARTVTRFVGQAGHHPVDQLELILQPTSTTLSTPLGQLDALYIRILSGVDWNITKIVLSSLAVFYGHCRETLSIIEVLLELKQGDAYRALRNLHSVVFIPRDLSSNWERISINEYRSLRHDESQYPRFLHKSFTDFLYDPQRASTFYVDQEEAGRRLALGCLKSLQNVTSASSTKLACLTWGYAYNRWDWHFCSTGTQGNQLLLLALDQLSLTSHYFLPWKLDRPEAWKKVAPLRLLEQWTEKPAEAIKHMEDVCQALGSRKVEYFCIDSLYNWIETQSDISSIAFLRLRMKLWYLYKLRNDDGWI